MLYNEHNSKSEAELEAKAEARELIEAHEIKIDRLESRIAGNERMVAYWKEKGDEERAAFYRNPIKAWKKEIKKHIDRINELKSALA